MSSPTTFNVSFIMTAVSDDRDLAGQVIGFFLFDIPLQLQNLEMAVAQADAFTAQRIAHSIKGASATVGAEELRVVAYAAENAGRDGKLDVLEELLPAIREKFEKTARLMRDEGFTAVD